MIHRVSIKKPETPKKIPASQAEEKPKPFQEWPAWAKTIAALSAKGETGVGDTVERMVGRFGGKKFEAWHVKIIGKPCGCADRKQRWNKLFPYFPETSG